MLEGAIENCWKLEGKAHLYNAIDTSQTAYIFVGRQYREILCNLPVLFVGGFVHGSASRI